MLNRRTARSASSNISDTETGNTTSSSLTEPNDNNSSSPTNNNNTNPTATTTTTHQQQQPRQQPKQTVKKKRKKSSSWKHYLPLCFVFTYVVVVMMALALLVRYLWNPSSKNKDGGGSSTAIISQFQAQQHDANRLKVGETSLDGTDPAHLEYPKILRPNNDDSTKPFYYYKYPILSQAALDMCTRTLWHTIETTTIVLPNKETFVHTGDIDDLWLRYSAAQVHPLLVPLFGPNRTQSLIATDAKLDRIVSGLIRRTATYIRHDPYANAFRIDDSYVFSQAQKRMGRHDLISTWNYELDSLAFWMRMVYFYAKQSPNGMRPESVVRLEKVQQAAEIMVDLWKAEQQHELDDVSVPRGPLFDCLNCNKPYRYPGLPRNGKGSPTNASAGLTWTGFRPSDDECKYGYLIPANMFAIVALEYVQDMATKIWKNSELAIKAHRLAQEIQLGIETHGIVTHPVHGKIYAYEVDGLGNSFVMDDANIPSLLSIPYLGYKHYDRQVYANTRRFILSHDNPYYHKGTNDITGEIEGYGSPHMERAIRNNIWPMSIAMQGLTSDDVEEKVRLVETLVKASAGTGWMHESFDVANPRHFTRS